MRAYLLPVVLFVAACSSEDDPQPGGAGGTAGLAGNAGSAGNSGAGGTTSAGTGGTSGDGGTAGGAGNAGLAGTGGGSGASGAGGVAGSGGTGGGATCTVSPLTIVHDPGTVGPAPTSKRLDPATHPTALCNDGSPGYYYFRRGTSNRRWIVYLEGGGNCFDSASCAERWNGGGGLMRSPRDGSATTNTELEGIKSADPAFNPDFYDANYVQIGYCSSDGWSGEKVADPTVTSTDDVEHWHFQGRAIVRAVFSEITKLGFDRASELLLAGSSAGAVGAYNHMDEVRGYIPSGVRMLALPDAGYLLDYPPYDTTTQKESTSALTPREVQGAIGIGNWGGYGDQSCEAVAQDLTARLRCRSPADLVNNGHLSVPTFIRQSQLDPVQVKQLVPTPVPRGSRRPCRLSVRASASRWPMRWPPCPSPLRSSHPTTTNTG